MKFYDSKQAPSPRRARIFIAEKGLEIETVEVDVFKGEQFGPEFRAVNPRCTIPVLVLDDGTVLADNVAIATYLELSHPEPPLMGKSTLEKTRILGWNSRAEIEGWQPMVDGFRNFFPALENRALPGPDDYAQIPELGTRGQARGAAFLNALDAHLEGRDYLVGDSFSLADITALCTVDFGITFSNVPIQDEQTNLKRWYDACSARPSAKL